MKDKFFFQGELLPVSVRSFGSGLLGIIDSLSSFLSVKLVPTLGDLIGLHGTFFVYFCVCVSTGCIMFFILPETSGKTLEDVEKIFASKTKSKPTQTIP